MISIERRITINITILVVFTIISLLTGCAHTGLSEDNAATTPTKAPTQETHYILHDQKKVTPVISSPIKEPLTSVTTEPKPEDVWKVLASGEILGDDSNKEVQEQLRQLENNQHYFDILASRAEPYFYPIIKELQQREMPLYLALLPMIESGYRANARSAWKAAGLWQIIPSTGDHLKLKQNWWYDGRHDTQASTLAALNYLQELHDRFDDWPLTLAAYNSGGATVAKAIKKNVKANRPSDYWSLKLPPETRKYIPKLIALDLIIRNPAKYGVKLNTLPLVQRLEIVNTGGQLQLQKAAELANIDIEVLRKLNPGLKRWATDPDGPHLLVLPIESVSPFEFGLARLPVDQRVTWQHYTVKSGDSLSAIAVKYGVSVALLKKSNQLKSNTIKIGKQLLIPYGSAEDFTFPAQAEKSKKTKLKNNKYKVKNGDSLWLIARRFDLHVEQILKWNNIKRETVLKPGAELKILL